MTSCVWRLLHTASCLQDDLGNQWARYRVICSIYTVEPRVPDVCGAVLVSTTMLQHPTMTPTINDSQQVSLRTLGYYNNDLIVYSNLCLWDLLCFQANLLYGGNYACNLTIDVPRYYYVSFALTHMHTWQYRFYFTQTLFPYIGPQTSNPKPKFKAQPISSPLHPSLVTSFPADGYNSGTREPSQSLTSSLSPYPPALLLLLT